MDDTKHTASQTDPNLEPRENRSSSLLVRKRLKMLKIYVANGCYLMTPGTWLKYETAHQH